MVQRGRKSAAAALSVITMPGHERPEPPAELTTEEADEWRAIVGRLPADWFTRETHGHLVNFCRHVVKARRIAELINAFDPEWLNCDEGLHRYDKLTHMAERESRALASLGTKMRLTQQSRMKENTAGRKAVPVPSRPWSESKSA